MAYQNVSTPRFYIDVLQYLRNMGADLRITDEENNDLPELYENIGNLNPVKANAFPERVVIDWSPNGTPIKEYEIGNIMYANQSYVAFLNQNKEMFFCFFSKTGEVFFLQLDNFSSVLNSQSESAFGFWGNDFRIRMIKKGCSIGTFDWGSYFDNENPSYNGIQINSNATSLGCLSFGSYFDMPNSPDLKLTMEVEYDGSDSITTSGGATITNIKYQGSPWWYDVDGNRVEPWSVGESNGVVKRNGRRSWNLKFSYMSDENLFASNYMINDHLEVSSDTSNYNSNDLNSNSDAFLYNINSDNSFISQVLNRVGNGQRFIFQPDNTNFNPDQFAICQLDQDSLSIRQSAFKVYDISLKIVEVW